MIFIVVCKRYNIHYMPYAFHSIQFVCAHAVWILYAGLHARARARLGWQIAHATKQQNTCDSKQWHECVVCVLFLLLVAWIEHVNMLIIRVSMQFARHRAGAAVLGSTPLTCSRPSARIVANGRRMHNGVQRRPGISTNRGLFRVGSDCDFNGIDAASSSPAGMLPVPACSVTWRRERRFVQTAHASAWSQHVERVACARNARFAACTNSVGDLLAGASARTTIARCADGLMNMVRCIEHIDGGAWLRLGWDFAFLPNNGRAARRMKRTIGTVSWDSGFYSGFINVVIINV